MKSTKQKLRGGGGSELTRFKALWRESLDESQREYWRDVFVSRTTQAQIRKQIAATLKIKLVRDQQLSAFRDWEHDQHQREQRAERARENERRIAEQHPGWTLDQVRDETLRQAYFESLASGDFKLGLDAVRVDLRQMEHFFGREKFAHQIKTDIEHGLDAVYLEIKDHPVALELFQKFKNVVSKATG